MYKKNIVLYFIIFLSAILLFQKVSAEGTESKLVLTAEKRKKEIGIDLVNRLEKEAQPFLKPNVHMIFNCNACHQKDQKMDKSMRKNRVEIPNEIKLKLCFTEKNEIKMCTVCHMEKCFHPVGIKPMELDSTMIISTYLPLGKNENSGQIVCTTCHNIHAEYTMNQLLRGFMEMPGQETTFYNRRENLCYDCHKSNMDNYDKPVSIIKHVHEGKRPDDTINRIACKFCHLQDNPEIAANISNPLLKKAFIEKNLRASITNICKYCHDENKNKIHYLDINPFADEYVKDLNVDVNMLLIGNKFTCIVCHDPHNKEQKRYHLRKQYIKLGERSKRISPHKKTDFCLSCHEIKNDANNIEIITAKFDGDWNQICNWCHKTKEARAETHPVNIILKEGKYIKKPKEFPLTKEGKINCLTCHFGGNYGCEENAKYSVYKNEKEGNLNRLRGWPYPGETVEERRWQVCLKCHIREGIAQYYVHYQMDTTSKKIIEATCMFCHSSRPDFEIEGMKKPDIKVPVKFLCISCHYRNSHSVSTGSDKGMDYHRYSLKEVPGKIVIPEGIDISDKNGTHCATCHNPHQEGLIGGGNAPIKGKERKRFLKCSDCHIDKR